MTKNDNKKLKEIIDLACEEAKRLGNTKVSPEHLFLGMLRMDQARAIDVLIALGVDFYEVKAKIEQKLNKQRDKSEEMPWILPWLPTVLLNGSSRRPGSWGMRK